MKTLKLVLIATILVFTTANVTHADGFKLKPKHKVIRVTLVQAMAVPGLPAAMVQQIDDDFLGCGCQAYYTAEVNLGNITYLITGSEREWTVFFYWFPGLIVNETDIR
jgi:hypothetical protein